MATAAAVLGAMIAGAPGAICALIGVTVVSAPLLVGAYSSDKFREYKSGYACSWLIGNGASAYSAYGIKKTEPVTPNTQNANPATGATVVIMEADANAQPTHPNTTVQHCLPADKLSDCSSSAILIGSLINAATSFPMSLTGTQKSLLFLLPSDPHLDKETASHIALTIATLTSLLQFSINSYFYYQKSTQSQQPAQQISTHPITEHTELSCMQLIRDEFIATALLLYAASSGIVLAYINYSITDNIALAISIGVMQFLITLNTKDKDLLGKRITEVKCIGTLVHYIRRLTGYNMQDLSSGMALGNVIMSIATARTIVTTGFGNNPQLGSAIICPLFIPYIMAAALIQGAFKKSLMPTNVSDNAVTSDCHLLQTVLTYIPHIIWRLPATISNILSLMLFTACDQVAEIIPIKLTAAYQYLVNFFNAYLTAKQMIHIIVDSHPNLNQAGQDGICLTYAFVAASSSFARVYPISKTMCEWRSGAQLKLSDSIIKEIAKLVSTICCYKPEDIDIEKKLTELVPMLSHEAEHYLQWTNGLNPQHLALEAAKHMAQ